MWKSHEQICETMGSNSLLISFQYESIKKSLPRVWHDMLCKKQKSSRQEDDEDNSEMYKIHSGDLVNLASVKTKQLYSILVETKKRDISVIYFWQEKLEVSQLFDWNDLFSFKFGKIFNNNVKQYNFKLLHRILPFKENLVKWKITSDIICRDCNDVETINHVLLFCPEVKSYWKKVMDIIYFLFNIDISMDEKILLIGYDVNNQNLILLNFMLVVAQYTIYQLYIMRNYSKISMSAYILLARFKKEVIMNLKYLVKKKIINFTPQQFSILENA